MNVCEHIYMYFVSARLVDIQIFMDVCEYNLQVFCE